MGSKGSNSKQQNLQQFSSVLSSAFLEWILMILLFLNGFFSYLVTKFARVNKLQTPCLLCSRLDHLITQTKPVFRSDFLCSSHKLEISSWVFCNAHGQLADLRSMCEKCLLSFFEDENLVPKIDTKFDHNDSSQVPLLNDDHDLTPNIKICSCCNEPIKENRSQVLRLLYDSKNRDRDGVESMDLSKTGTNHEVILEKDTHVEYNELKTYDSDSELVQVNRDIVNICDENDHSSNEKPIMDELHNETESHSSESEEKETNLLDENDYSSNPIMDELQNKTESHSSESEEKENNLLDENSHEDSILVNLKDSIAKDKLENTTSLNDPPTIINPNPNPIPSPSGSMSLNDAYNLAIGNKTSLTSPKFEDVITGKDSARVYDELKLLISQISAARGLDSPWNDISSSPRLQQLGDGHVLYNITTTLSLERNESLYRVDSFEGSIVSEIEGEGSVERLKRQVDLDRKSISLLYKELEEERNASAIAANQAMAMITRLQADKASMQMEALQYQRMMEEQVEYDQEVLQKCSELILEKDKTIQELEIELAPYRDRVVHDWDDLSLLGFEEQKKYISKKLSEIEDKLHVFSNNSSFVDPIKLASIDEEVEEEEEESTSEKENFRRENSEILNFEIATKRETRMKGLVELEEEISRVYQRLKGLEADHNFLEHSLNSIQNGQEGVRFIRDIAFSLQELRNLGVMHGKN